MRRAPGSEPIREAEKVRLIDAVEHLHDGTLDDLVLQRRDPQRTQPAIRLGDIRPSRRPCAIAAALNLPVQIREVVLQIDPIVLPRHLINPGRGLRVDRPIGLPQPIN